MNVAITFRHMDSSDAIKDYATAKVAKLQKLLRQPMTARVTISLEKLEHCVEVQLSSGSQHAEAKEVSADTYASIDAVTDKLERQIRSLKGSTQSRRHNGESVRHPESVAMSGRESTRAATAASALES